MIKYFKESFEELKKVSWPTFNQLVKLTVVVVVFSTIFAIAVGIFDYGLNQGYQQVLRWANQVNPSASTPTVDINPEDLGIELADPETGEPISSEDAGVTINTETSETPTE